MKFELIIPYNIMQRCINCAHRQPSSRQGFDYCTIMNSYIIWYDVTCENSCSCFEHEIYKACDVCANNNRCIYKSAMGQFIVYDELPTRLRLLPEELRKLKKDIRDNDKTCLIVHVPFCADNDDVFIKIRGCYD